MAITEVVFAMMMIVNGSMDGFMKTEGLSHCLKLKEKASATWQTIEQTLFVMSVVKY